MGKRLEILQDLQAALTEISLVNNYQTDIGSNVVYWQDTDFEYGESVLEFRDTVEETVKVNYPYEKLLTVEISVINSTNTSLLQASRILEDLEKAVNKFKVQDGRVLMLSNEKMLETKGKKNIRIKLKIKIQYRELLEL